MYFTRGYNLLHLFYHKYTFWIKILLLMTDVRRSVISAVKIFGVIIYKGSVVY